MQRLKKNRHKSERIYGYWLLRRYIMKAVGIDIGTTTISAVIVAEDSRSVEKSFTISNGSFIKTGTIW